MFGLISIRCPFCLRKVLVDKSYRCPNKDCSMQLDARYVKSYPSHPAFFLPLLGVSKVGKTVFLQVLMLTLRRITRLWSNSSAVAADMSTQEYIRKAETRFISGGLPVMTQPGSHEVHMMYLQDVSPWRDMTLIFRDLSGEHYSDLVFPPEVGNFLAEQSILLMMLSLPDVLRGHYTIDELINNYVHTQRSSDERIAHKPKRMIVVLTKADVVTNIPPNIRSYLYNDTIWDDVHNAAIKPLDSSVFMRNHLALMRKAHSSIRTWLRYELAPVTALANHEHIELYFCIISSLGSPPQSGKLANPLHPYRILDPLLWALELGSEHTRKR